MAQEQQNPHENWLPYVYVRAWSLPGPKHSSPCDMLKLFCQLLQFPDSCAASVSKRCLQVHLLPSFLLVAKPLDSLNMSPATPTFLHSPAICSVKSCMVFIIKITTLTSTADKPREQCKDSYDIKSVSLIGSKPHRVL